jgi:hypothetical protein
MMTLPALRKGMGEARVKLRKLMRRMVAEAYIFVGWSVVGLVGKCWKVCGCEDSE